MFLCIGLCGRYLHWSGNLDCLILCKHLFTQMSNLQDYESVAKYCALFNQLAKHMDVHMAILHVVDESVSVNKKK